MIPKIIHQIWFGDQLKRPVNWMKTFSIKNPDWKYMLWTEENLPKLSNQDKFDYILKYGKTNDNYAKLADIARYEILYRYGGIYLDADSECLRSLDPPINNEIFSVYGGEDAKIISNAIIGCTCNNSIIKETIDHIASLNNSLLSQTPAWKITGPALWTKILSNHPEVKIYDSFYFLPTRHPRDFFRMFKRKNMKNSYTDHHWFTTTKITKEYILQLFTYKQLKRHIIKLLRK
jgi:mannosyltransferase OCH1-like enzyme